MRALVRFTGAIAAAALAVAGCSQILGIDHFTSGDGGGSSTDAPVTDAPATDGPTTDGPTTDGPTTDGAPVDAPSMPDAPPMVDAGPCDIYTQAGCQSGEKCAWIIDSTNPGAGHSGCEPDGSVALGGACTLSGGTIGYDDCTAGGICAGGICQPICDATNGTLGCGAQAVCQSYSFPGTVIGACVPRCDPLADNNFGFANKPGTTCAASDGCYGAPQSTGKPTAFLCAKEVNQNFYNRAACDMSNGCGPYLNGCSQGYEPLVYDDDVGSSTVVCIAMCKPTDCYMGKCGTNNVDRFGAAPHRCNTTDAKGTFDSSQDGDHCMYSWWFEQDGSTGKVLKSPTSDTLGFCMDHQKVHLKDASGNPDSTQPWPACANLPIMGTGQCSAGNPSGCGAVDLGCVSTSTGMVPTQRIAPPVVERPRLPYHSSVRAW